MYYEPVNIIFCNIFYIIISVTTSKEKLETLNVDQSFLLN